MYFNNIVRIIHKAFLYVWTCVYTDEIDFMLEKERKKEEEPHHVSTTAFNFMWLLSATMLASNLISSHCH